MRLGNFVQFRSEFNSEMEAVFSGQKTPEEAVADLKERGDRLLRQFERTYRGKTLP